MSAFHKAFVFPTATPIQSALFPLSTCPKSLHMLPLSSRHITPSVISQDFLSSSTTPTVLPSVSASASASNNASKKNNYRSKRKTANDINRERERRSRRTEKRRPLIAVWNTIIIAESTNYEFLDGRFLFPKENVRWDLLERSTKSKHFNPVGKVILYDIVFKSESSKPKRKGQVILRNKGAVMKFEGLRSQWRTIEGYTCFWKGVQLFQKPDGFCERVAPGMKPEVPKSIAADDAIVDGLETSDTFIQHRIANDWNDDYDPR